MRPFPFATTISVLISVATAGAQQMLNQPEYAWLWPWVTYGGFGLAGAVFLCGLYFHFRRKGKDRTQDGQAGQVSSGAGSVAVGRDVSGFVHSPVTIHRAGD